MHDNPFQRALAAAHTHAAAFLDAQSTAPVDATTTLEELRQRLDIPLADAPLDPAQVIEELVAGAGGGIVGSGSGRFFGWVIGGALPAALAADWLTSTWDQNACLYAAGPAASVVEETCGRWLKELLCIPETASFALLTGCQMAHVTSLAAARHALLAARGWDVEQQGLAGSPAIRVLTSTEKHGTTTRALRLLGIGERQIESLPVGEDGRLPEPELRRALEQDSAAPTIVVLQAGDLNLGAFDDFRTLIPLAHRHNAWVHIDGAFGLWAAASPRLRHLLDGAGLADSWATDGHKWLNVPYDCGYAFVADARAHHDTFSYHAPYLLSGDGDQSGSVRDQLNWGPEWSRRGRGFATYAALRQLGRAGVAELMERNCEQAGALVTRIGALPGAELLWQPQINQGLVRFLDPAGEGHDAFTDRVIARINATGEAFFTGTTWRGQRAMRISVCNWQTSSDDVDRAVAAVVAALAIS